MHEPAVDRSEVPAYEPSEAAAYLHMPYAVVRCWTQDEVLVQPSGSHLLSYANLLELHILKGLQKEHQLPMQHVRCALEHHGARHETAHPLLDPRLVTNGFSLLLEQAGCGNGSFSVGSVVERYMRRIERKREQLNFYPFVLPDRDGEDEPRSILISPTVAFGRPVLAGTGVTTEVIAGRFMARDSLFELAEEYKVSPNQIEEVIRWESPQLKHAA